MKGKLIVIEGTDCSGKETQTKKLVDRLNENGHPSVRMTFPDYDTPTGKIIGGPYLGKEYISEGWFPETAPLVDARVSCLYYAADRKYNIHKVNEQLNNGVNVILDRYTYSNMGHQGGKIADKNDRMCLYNWIEYLEFVMLELPEPDIKIFLHMPLEAATILKQGRVSEDADQNERDQEHLKNAEMAFKEVANKYNFKWIECVKNGQIKTIDEIHEELYKKINVRNRVLKKVK